MEQNNKLRLLLFRVLAGRTKFNNIYYYRSPNIEQILESQYLYNDMLYESQLMDVLTDNDMLEYMLNNELWSDAEEIELKTASERIDQLKLEMFRQYNSFRSYQMERARRLLHKTKERTSELFQKRHTFDLFTCEGLSSAYQLNFLILNNIYREDRKIHPTKISYKLSQRLLNHYVNNCPQDSDLRQLSKIDKWRIIWNSSKNEHSLFGRPAILLTDDQKNLVSWSRLYDSVSECSESPDKAIVEDDDLLDGWLIYYHKKQENSKKENDNGSDRMPGAQEIFIPAESPDDIRRINEMNSADANFTKQQRASVLKRYGSVAEEQMPDSKQQMIMQATQQFKQAMRR